MSGGRRRREFETRQEESNSIMGAVSSKLEDLLHYVLPSSISDWILDRRAGGWTMLWWGGDEDNGPTSVSPASIRVPPRPNFNSWQRSVLDGKDLKNQRVGTSQPPLAEHLGYDLAGAMTIQGVPLIDTHCHIDFIFKRLYPNQPLTFAEFRQEFHTTFPRSLHSVVAVFCQPDKWLKFGLEMRLEEESGVNVIYGCHPHFADTFDLGHKLVLSGLLSRRNVVGLGEIGLDYSMKNGVNMEIQKGTFKVQLRMALERKLPICLHIRDATEDGFTILEQESVPKDYRIHVHCFNSNWEDCERWLNSYPKCKIGLTPLITYPKAVHLFEVVKRIPLDRLILETDSPYFMPAKVYEGADENQLLSNTTHPGYVAHAAARVAQVKGMRLSQVIKVTGQNAIEVYGLNEDFKLEKVEPEIVDGTVEVGGDSGEAQATKLEDSWLA